MVELIHKAALIIEVIKGRIKRILKRIYFKIMEIIYFNSRTWISDDYTIKKVGLIENSETFFGYYDKYPENKEGTHILFHRTYLSTRYKPNPEEPVEIVLFNKKNNKEKVVGQTTAYNWQQGARLMWLDNKSFIFNIFDKEFSSIKYCISNNKSTRYPFTINDSFGDEFSLTLNYSRLNKVRPDYGYQNIDSQADLDDDKDGIFLNDHFSKTQRLLISIESLKQKVHKRYHEYDHWVNHIMISPDGSKFMFIHRWAYKSAKRHDLLYLYDLKTNSLELLSKFGMVSHMNWITNKEIFGFLKGPVGNGYYSIDLTNKELSLSKIFRQKTDGHPTICAQYAITDCYPNKKRMKNLFHYSFKNDLTSHIGSFKESTIFWGPTRCDLHPRLSDNSDIIYFDSVHEGFRRMYLLAPIKQC